VLARYRRHVVLADATVASLGATLAITLRFDGETPGQWSLVPGVVPLIWIAALALHRTYEQRFLGSGTDEFERVLRSGLVLFTFIAVSAYLLNSNISRSIVVFMVPVTVLGSLAARKILRHRLHRARAAGLGLEKTIVVGGRDAVVHLVKLLRSAPYRGMDPVGVCLPALSTPPPELDDIPVLGGPDDVLEAVDLTGAHVVAVVSHPDLWGHPLRKLAWALEERDVELIVSPGIVEVAGPRLSIRPTAGLSLLHLERPSAGGGQTLLKAAFDRLIGTLMLVLIAPLLFAIAAAIRITGAGPALTKEARVGAGGREFSMYKFRTRAPDQGAQDGGTRVTAIGQRLLRHSLDELPQLLNVAKGEMSLVGPRPPVPSQTADYSDDAIRRLRVRPGMTGLWQVSGRSTLSWEQSLQLDLRYVDNWTMFLDLSILWRTIRTVIKDSGDG
jgi:exopolysaccharide biosynthesis polyprenyl glycosylphosphotransferase